MIQLRSFRFWTTLAVVLLSLTAITQGWTALQLGLAEQGADAANAEARFSPFAGDGLVGDAARRDSLRLAPPAAPRKKIDAVSALLSQTPLNGGAWLDLAIARRAAGDKMENVAAALAMSATTGPNEGYLMAGRASFALPFWSALPLDARKSLVADLVGGWEFLDKEGRERLAAILAAAPDRSPEELRAALLLAGAQGVAIAAALFSGPAQPPPAAAPDAGAAGK
jgi:hypothetical protein